MLQLNKRDVLTITVLMVVFLGIATWNLGNSVAPQTTVEFSPGQSFYVDLGTSVNVKSVVFLMMDVKESDGSFTFIVSTGTPASWQQAQSTGIQYDYYKWKEISIQRETQYLQVNFTGSSNPVLGEFGVINTNNQTVAIASINNLGSGNPALSNLVDEQGTIQYPATYMSQTYFDEIYFVRTAEQYLHKEWPYEWTHPPLGKFIQAGGIVTLGFTPFGWRIMGVLFAMLMIPIMYLLGKKLFGTWIGAFAASFLLTFDFMHFTMGRMGTADTFVVFFSLLSQLCFLVYFLNVLQKGWRTSVVPLFLAVVFFALGFSTKWLVIYGAVGMLALLVAVRIRDLSKLKASLGAKYAAFFDHPFLLLMGFIGVAVGIYLLIYIPDMWIGRPFIGTNGSGILDLQFSMYGYHANLVATHTFSSPWYSWPFMVNIGQNLADPRLPAYVPLWLEVAEVVSPNLVKSTISVFGNPSVWWVGFASMLVIAMTAVDGGDVSGWVEPKLSRAFWRLRAKLSKTNVGGAGSLGTAKQSTAVEPVMSVETVASGETSATLEGEMSEADVAKALAKSRRKHALFAVIGVAIFSITAVVSELVKYHSFLLAFPLYFGLLLTAYGMIARLGVNVEAKDVAPIFIMVVFFFSWIPYVFIGRVTFMYHFYVAMPFLCLSTAYLVNKYWSTKAGKIAAIALFVVVVLMFVLFFPVISGVPVSSDWISKLRWFPSWYF
jgi:dolichyl-phosphate-mannose-protein mannosyltransferase